MHGVCSLLIDRRVHGRACKKKQRPTSDPSALVPPLHPPTICSNLECLNEKHGHPATNVLKQGYREDGEDGGGSWLGAWRVGQSLARWCRK